MFSVQNCLFTMRSGFFLSGAWAALVTWTLSFSKGPILPSWHLQLADKGCLEGKGAVVLPECMARGAAGATSPAEKQDARNAEIQWAEAISELRDTLGFPKEECPAHFSAWFDLRGV